MKKQIIILAISSFLISYEEVKTAEELFNISLIHGQRYSGEATKFKLCGMTLVYFNLLNEIHEPASCSLTLSEQFLLALLQKTKSNCYA